MVRVIFCVALLLSGCAFNPPVKSAARVIVKERVLEKERVVEVNRACPTDAEIRDAAVVASQDIYKQAPGGSRTCPCPDSTASDGSRCGDRGAKGWLDCSREDDPCGEVARDSLQAYSDAPRRGLEEVSRQAIEGDGRSSGVAHRQEVWRLRAG